MYTISKHAKERYSERIMNKDSVSDINRYVIENEDKITTDINKMIEYGNCIFKGKHKHEGKTADISVFVKDLWIVLADTARNNVITLYKVDLGLDEDFNKQYMAKMLAKLEEVKQESESKRVAWMEENVKYIEMINDNINQINEYKGYIKNLEELNSAYKTITENNGVNISIAEKNIVDVVNSLIGKKEF